MDKIRVDGANGIRFSTRKIFSSGGALPFNGLGTSSASASESMLRIPKTDINPNKAVFTIDSKTSNILIVNNKACQLLDYRPSELCDMKFSALLTNKTNKSYASSLAEGQLNSEDGTMVLLSGKVVEMTSKNGTKVAVSLWIRQIDADGRCLAICEPVERRVAQIIVDKNGKIVAADAETLMLFQIDAEEELIQSDIRHLIPAIQLPNAEKTTYKQKATGKTKDNLSFPLCLMITAQNDAENNHSDKSVDSSKQLFVITIWVFQNISGLVVIDEHGSIELCNHHFSMLMFGYAQSKITRLHITHLIPNFAQEFEYLGIGEWNYNSRSRNITFSSLDNESETETDPVYYEAESFYATPVGTTASDRSKSINDNEMHDISISNAINQIKAPDISKAISEPIQICLDSSMMSSKNALKSSTNGKSSNDENDAQRVNVENKLFTFGKSLSDNTLGEDKCNDAKQHSNEFGDTLKTRSGIRAARKHSKIDQIKSSDKEDETSNCDASELLTPVNETNLSDGYLIEPDASDHISGYDQSDLTDALKDLEIDASIDSNVNEKDKSYNSTLQRNQNTSKTQKSNSRRFSTQQNTFADGKYKGQATHCDGNIFNILYTISSQDLPCGRKVFCVWICRDECDLDDDEDDDKHLNLTFTFNSIASNIETSVDGLGTAKRNSMNVNTNQSSRPNSVSLLSQYEDEHVSEFFRHYTNLKQIGKGAFGYVKLSFRHSDRLLVVTKFIAKDKLPPQFMVIADDKKEIPMEIYLLSTLKHPNIVTVLDVFENEKFFQLVMEKHGSGMDLFEFIDRRPLMDEQLGSYIFRQIVNAIDYLHSLKILHRDIKDENIIIDQFFHVKLIDFGSATFMEDGKLFSTFYGTTEYCSPEVLAGNKYAGPELEIWALGITLFVLIFFENPFIDIEETLHSDLNLPHKVSPALEKILTSMLDKNPKIRCTMKQLIADPWVTQDINACNFNFSWIVPCEPIESNPEKYFTGQIYSSATGLSTTSPTSLADEEDSIIDDDIEDEELFEEACSMQLSQEFDYRKCRKSNENCEHKDLESIDASNEQLPTANATIINATTNTGKALQLPIATAKTLSPQVANSKRNQITQNSIHHHLDPIKANNKCNCSLASQNKRANIRDPCEINHCMKKESFSCDSISKSSYIPIADDRLVNTTSTRTSRSPKSLEIDCDSIGNTISIVNPSVSPIISLSKSETNISDSNVETDAMTQLTIYNVVSLNDLQSENGSLFNSRVITDPSKNQYLSNSSENDLYDLSPKKHIVTLTNPKVLTTVTVSMRNAADVSDKVF